MLPPRPPEQLLIDLIPSLPSGSLICNTLGRGQFAAAYSRHWPQGNATLWSFDDYHHQLIEQDLADRAPNLHLLCQPDLPSGPFDIAALLVHRQGDGELVRDLLQQMCLRLKDGGLLLAASDNPRDTWLADQIDKLFVERARQQHEAGVAYQAKRIAPPKKLKHYDADFVCRDGEHLLKLHTRPGVFSHREVDPGARALMHAMKITPGTRALDIGCGSGVVGLAAAAREPTSIVRAIDSNARAVQCANYSASTNGLANFNASLDSTGDSLADRSFDLALANPPYYSHHRIAEHFVRIAARTLRRGGELIVVTKDPAWYLEHLPAIGFAAPTAEPHKRYWLVRCRSSSG